MSSREFQMQIRSFFRWHSWAVACAVLAGLLAAPAAKAATINSYSFTQGGYDSLLSVRGAFTGVVGDDGYMRLADLTDFYIQGFPLLTGDSRPTMFSFNTGPGNASTLFIVATLRDLYGSLGNYTLCTGAATFLVCNVQNQLGAIVNARGGTYTTDLPDITLLSSKPIVVPTTTPSPGALLLFATALGGLGPVAVAKRRRVGRTA
jgi:hypothetical protein